MIHRLTKPGNNIYSCVATFSRQLILYIALDANHLFHIPPMINTSQHSSEETTVMAEQGETGALVPHRLHDMFIRVPADRHIEPIGSCDLPITAPSVNVTYEYTTLLNDNEEARLDDLPIGTPVPHTSVEAEVVEPTVTAPEANVTNASTTLLDDGEASNRDDLPLETIASRTSAAAETVQPSLATPGTNVTNVAATLLDDSEGSVQDNLLVVILVSHPRVASEVVEPSVASQRR